MLKTQKFQVGDIVTIKSVQAEWPEKDIIIKRGMKGKIFDKWESMDKDIDYFYYVEFPQGKVILMGDYMIKISKKGVEKDAKR